ncbi:WEB family protein At5g55860-like [Diospyros lotus]|uniref:WEB family protein At5g55860-like n=1 Tax=Diospyros lotus TaxID=55363 RepID=UPI002255C404|nr:WEB family protein At5g55860-like [Diospyros lotus]XP_052207663.1 WEB family protein At5g55860-like [Diospyros lotus]XP_052207664.1 WEB family protein At5g55860-like [Diospyros lotus]XP_052207665.1 WEB family protein At5g55860-like [Diospyros lotus]XP_052207666.1 WEB family protein At5g55860-like [Diospyros lotus]XP_052207667.1 WEB family protein At5g55860-like [Diospyros lotus]XP_052207669.1 WEB family protein At5g55860-like [Diospyros lotus]XP_052207670.1 WEB family protein At5g55860-li
MGEKDCPNTPDSVKVGFGEIDTRAPFQSVKDAVSLFGEGTFSGEKPATKKAKPYSAERVLTKETQLHLVQKELHKLKEQLKNAETTKVQTLVELEEAKRTVDDLSQKLKNITESKQSAATVTQGVKNQMKQLEGTKSDCLVATNGAGKQDLESKREWNKKLSITEQGAAKQLLRQIFLDCNAIQEAKTIAFRQAIEAEDEVKANLEKFGELFKEITTIEESIWQVKLAVMQVEQEQVKISAKKGIQKQLYIAILEELAKKWLALKKDFDPELNKDLGGQLPETVAEIGALQNELENVKGSYRNSISTVTLELDGDKDSLHKVAEEESPLRSLVESLKLELVNVQREPSELKKKEAEMGYAKGNLRVKLCKSKSELEAALAGESKVRGASKEVTSSLHQISSESENARPEAEEMKNKVEELMKETEATRIALEAAEMKLVVALEEAEDAKAAEARAVEEIKMLSERTSAARTSAFESNAQITISREEFVALNWKVDESEKLAEMKVAAAVAQVEAVKASEQENLLQRLEASRKEIDDMKAATEEFLKRAEAAEAAKKAVETELRRWCDREKKKAAEAASRILAEADLSSESSLDHRIQMQKPLDGVNSSRKLEKQKTNSSRKLLLPNLSSLFHRKKNQIEIGFPSYLPGEDPPL